MIGKQNKTKYFLLSILITIIGLLTNIGIVKAETQDKNIVNIYFFHSNTCSHCRSEIKLLDDLENRYDNIKIYSYEVNEEDNNQKWTQVQELYQIKGNGVPLTIIGDTYYSGYKEEKSSLEFIKTIEYYSRYGYEDKTGNLLGINTSSTYEIKEDNPTLEEFMDRYGNYKIIGNLYTDDVSLSVSAIILGILSQLNIIKLLAISLGLILISKVKSIKDKIILSLGYFGILMMWTTTNIFSNDIYTLIIELIILILCILALVKYSRTKSPQTKSVNILIIIAILSNYLETNFFNYQNQTFNNLINLYNLSSYDKTMYYIDYIFTIIIINILVILLFYYIKKVIKKSVKVNK